MTIRVKGHGLLREGRTRDQWVFGSGDPTGVGECSCGEQSPDLASTADRQRWHKGHKQAILDGAR